MTYDRHGFYFPQVDTAKCVNCRKCVSVCPVNHPVGKYDILSVHKGYAVDIDSEENRKSTSGAIFGLLAEHMIAKGGNVVGVAFDKDYTNVKHIVCKTMVQVDDCRGSKYIQSRTKGVYKEVRGLLRHGNMVLFSGTPCQIAGLRSFLGDSPDNLLTVDFVCHGVASTKFYQEYLGTVTDKGISYVGFRDKCGDYRHSRFRVMDAEEQSVAEEIWAEKSFGKAFANNLVSRTSCGICSYATAQRVADISLADNYLFIDETESKQGSSLVFINTPKGVAWFDAVRSKAIVEDLSKDTVIPQIMHFAHPAIPHKDRDKLLNALVKGGYSAAEKYISEYAPKQSIVQGFKSLIGRLLCK